MSQPVRGDPGLDAAMRAAKASYERCCADSSFFRAFYDDFFARCPEAKPRFARTDFERQNKLLRHAFGLLLIFPNQARTEPSVLTRVAERHSRRDLDIPRSEEHTSELQSRSDLVCRLLLEKKKNAQHDTPRRT